ncbi:fibropellin-1-like [Mercenaria mercenaria]|uniref:fibropellin-1-like n=1 Tax=Mercenaria mercenaria TaxID=6596 RepID=UPI00234EE4E1|nr:fibropellin-1-like [Mercenaria mercenaria]
MHFTAGDNFGFVGRCPALTETSRSPVQGVHIFDGKRQATECTTDVSYVPPAVDGEHILCLQVALPGKKGEKRCYTIKVVNDTQKEVISPCRGVTCEHGGKCLADFRSNPPKTSCLCMSGFTGNECKTDIDDCSPNPCQNGATCVDQVNNYTCTCNLGYTGRDCDIDIGDCVPNPCKNGASCVDEGNNYTCTCYPGHTGRNCEIVLDPCSSNPCLRGTCFHHAPKYHCLCPTGYTGKKCESSINECQSQPCLNGGVCVDNIGYFTCNCSNGFVGKLCETDVDECISQPCLNGGFCKDGINQFLCQCRAGFDGDRCQNGIDPCTSNPCVRGICFSHESQFLCECPKGFTGELCETTLQLTLNGPKETFLKVPVGSELTLNCSISGLHPPTLYWSKLNGCGFKHENIKELDLTGKFYSPLLNLERDYAVQDDEEIATVVAEAHGGCLVETQQGYAPAIEQKDKADVLKYELEK